MTIIDLGLLITKEGVPLIGQRVRIVGMRAVFDVLEIKCITRT